MPDTGFLFFSLVSLMVGAVFILFPHPLSKLSTTLNKTLVLADDHIMRYRHVIGVLLMLVSYGLFKLALWMPALRG